MNQTNPELADLATVTDTALLAGLIAHSCGGDTARTSNVMRRAALALGAERADTVVSSLNLGLTVEYGSLRETALRKAPHMGVNFRALNAVERAVHTLESGRIGREAFHNLLVQIEHWPRHYPTWLVAVLVGLACGGFAALFHGDVYAIAITTLGSGLGMALRQWLTARHFQPLIFATASAFLSTLVVGLSRHYTATPDAALAACVLFLIPGVPLINGMSDLLTGNYLNGNVRLTMSAVFILGIALGMSLALRVTGS